MRYVDQGTFHEINMPSCKKVPYLCKALKTFVLICMNDFLKTKQSTDDVPLKICGSIDDVTMSLHMRAINDDITIMGLGMRATVQCKSARNLPHANYYYGGWIFQSNAVFSAKCEIHD